MEKRLQLMARMISKQFIHDREIVRDLIAAINTLSPDPSLEGIYSLTYHLYKTMPPVAPTMALTLQANSHAARNR